MKTKIKQDEFYQLMQAKIAIYYVVKGRKLINPVSNESFFFEKIFIEENPILAREKAFSYYKNYISILEENQLLTKTPLNNFPCYLNEDFEGIELQQYSSSNIVYESSELFDKGVAIYMVINKPMTSLRLHDKEGDRFLIHGIWNFVLGDILTMIRGLKQEYAYYVDYEYHMSGCVIHTNFSVYDKRYSQNYILSTPFNWDNNYYTAQNQQKIQKTVQIKFLQDAIRFGSLEENEYTSKLTKKSMIMNIASLLNHKGGYLFYGINTSRKSENKLSKVNLANFKTKVELILLSEFVTVPQSISLRFIKVGENIVALFEVKEFGVHPVFVKINGKSKFFIRDVHGAFEIKDPQEIYNYCKNKRRNIF
jgi:hypothetical protein